MCVSGASSQAELFCSFYPPMSYAMDIKFHKASTDLVSTITGPSEQAQKQALDAESEKMVVLNVMRTFERLLSLMYALSSVFCLSLSYTCLLHFTADHTYNFHVRRAGIRGASVASSSQPLKEEDLEFYFNITGNSLSKQRHTNSISIASHTTDGDAAPASRGARLSLTTPALWQDQELRAGQAHEFAATPPNQQRPSMRTRQATPPLKDSELFDVAPSRRRSSSWIASTLFTL